MSLRLIHRITFGAGAALLGLWLSPAAYTQDPGPLPAGPPASRPKSQPRTQPDAPASQTYHTPTPPQKLHSPGDNPIVNEPPSIPVEQVVKRFAEREAEFKRERDNYTYTQTFVIQTIDEYSGRPDGEYRMTSDILFTPAGKRYEHVTDAPAPSLQRISMSQQDFDDLEHVQPFVLTTDEVQKYDVKYAGQQQLDEINAYVFDVAPKKIEKNQRYFQGRIWVDQKDFGIVKTDGKAVPDIKKHGQENVFPRFETFRENIEGHFWFPTYTHSEDTLQFSGGGVRIRMTVRYENYKRFGSTIKIGQATEVPKDKQ